MKCITLFKQRRFTTTTATRLVNTFTRELITRKTSVISINNTEFITQERFTYHPTLSPNTTQFCDHILQLPKWQQVLIKHFQKSEDIESSITFIKITNNLSSHLMGTNLERRPVEEL